eukprot:TRINITY_DN2296_c0_g1_i16.p1 TRINITY_DN2296_c0_g1~~TRINITY_DN2296_c0_g1_i16.p1  ORF type:complete len:169 (+),score=33.04 TRINITY_DN2296_c0_g1_i16:926-1432(+)
MEPAYIKAPYIAYDETVIYPVVKDEGARTGHLDVDRVKKLVIDFNCLGTEIRTKTILTVEVPLHSPIRLYIEKECKKEDFVDMLTGKMGPQGTGSEIFNIVFVCLFSFIVIFMVVTLCNLCSGKELSKSVPCGGNFILYMCGPDSGARVHVPNQAKVSEMTVHLLSNL